ncbi:MAG: PAS domain-containing protein, partial [Ekhidna sp.]|nr:PAS domain-containing protein [Ekhidna sp.]
QEIAKIGAWTVDLRERNKNWWSDSMKTIHGLKPEDPPPSLDYYDRVNKNDVEPFIEAFEAASKTGSYEFTYRMRRYSDDKEIILHAISKVFRDAENNPLMHVGIAQDVTEQTELQSELKKTNKKLSSIIDSVPGVVFNCAFDDAYSMNFISSYAEQLTGYKAEEFYPTGDFKFADLVHPDDTESLRNQLRKALAEKRKYIFNYRIITKQGDDKWVLENGEFVHGKKGKITIDGVIIDISERMKAEDRMLQEVYEAEDKTRRKISQEIHDGLQQSLITAKLNLDAVIKEAMVLSIGTQKRLNTGMDYLGKSINETRAIAHVLMPKAIKDFGLVAAVENLLENLHSKVEFHLTENLREERISRVIELGLFRIIQESVNNIMKYSEAKKAFIQINKMEELISMTIEDDGKGFDTQDILSKNKGFGLMSMQSRVSAMNGFIEIESEPGSGTMILVEIPLAKKIEISS